MSEKVIETQVIHFDIRKILKKMFNYNENNFNENENSGLIRKITVKIIV